MARTPRFADDLVPIGQFKSQAAKCLDDVRKGRTIVVTQNGTAAAVVMSPERFDALQDRQQLLEQIALGLSDIESKRLISTTALRKRLAKNR